MRTRQIRPLRVLLVGALAVGVAMSFLATAGAQTKRPKIAYLQVDSFAYYDYGAAGAKAMAKKLGADVVVFNAGGKTAKEIANAENAIQLGVDGVVYQPVVRASGLAVLAKLKAANIPVAVLGGSYIDPAYLKSGLYFLSAAVSQVGRDLGVWAAKNLKSGEIAVIQGALGRGDVESYTKAFKLAAEKNPNLKVVATPAADWARPKAVSAMENILTRYPNLTAVYVHNEDMALGAIQAIKAAGKMGQVKVITQNGSPEGLKAIRAGEIVVTAGWSPSFEGATLTNRVLSFLKGKKPAHQVCTDPYHLITKQNINTAVPWAAGPAVLKAVDRFKC